MRTVRPYVSSAGITRRLCVLAMARSLLFVCLWAVVLLVYVEQCHADDSDGSTETCTKEMEEKEGKCAKIGQTCDENTGTCVCEAPKQLIGGQCRETCTKEMEEKEGKCAKIGQTCDENTGTCVCEAPKQLIGGQCRGEKSAATEAMTTPSAPTPESTKGEKSAATEAMTTPSAPTSESPKDPCEEIRDECQKDEKTCKVIMGEAKCVCPPTLKENENGDCFLAKKVTVTLRLKPRKKRSTTYSEESICENEEYRKELIREIMEKVPNAIEESIVCKGNHVSFDVFDENNDGEKKIRDEILKNCQGDDCNMGKVIRFDSNSVDVKATNMCEEEETRKLAVKMGMICEYDTTTRMSCNKNKTTVIGKTTLQGIPFEICKALPCSRTCTGNNTHCVQESCVCKPQYKLEDGKCKSVCKLNNPVCPSGANCVPGEGDQSFYCECPPKLTGPLCKRENKPLQTAKLNIVVVGVVLASLLLLCFVVSASIISRLRKKAQGPSFSKDCERRPQRELRGYDGPYKASDPASLHRGRDHTSL